jgi:hypothetical protein
MRRVLLKIVDFHGVNGESLPPLHYSEAIVLMAKTPAQPGAGLSAEEMEPALAIEDAVKIACDQPRAGEECCVFFEEAHWSWLVQRLKANRFPFSSHAFKNLVDDVEAAPKVDPNRLNGGGPVDKAEVETGAASRLPMPASL